MTPGEQMKALMALGYEKHELLHVVGQFKAEKDLEKQVINLSRFEAVVVRYIWREYGADNYYKGLALDIMQRALKEGQE